MSANNKGKVIFILGTTGSGKSTLLSILKERHDEFIYPCSVVTRPIRKGEIDGREYKFVSKVEFKNMISNGEFLEYALVHGKGYYGTLKKDIDDAINSGKIVIKLIDYQGLVMAKKFILENEMKSIFIMPPSFQVIEKRIRDRANISDDEVEKRLNSARKELKNLDLYDVKIEAIDGDIEGSYKKFEKEILKIKNIWFTLKIDLQCFALSKYLHTSIKTILMK